MSHALIASPQRLFRGSSGECENVRHDGANSRDMHEAGSDKLRSCPKRNGQV